MKIIRTADSWLNLAAVAIASRDNGKLTVCMVGGSTAVLDGADAAAVEDALNRAAHEAHEDLRRHRSAAAWEAPAKS